MSGPASVIRSTVGANFDPPDAVTRLGVIALATDLTTERDAARLVPRDRAALHVTRVAHDNPSTPENLRKMGTRLTAAAEMLVPVPGLAAILYSCTAGSVAIGDAAVAEAVNRVCRGVPVVTPPDAAVQSFAALGVCRIVLVTPYLVETTVPVATYFARRGLEIVSAQCLGIADDRDMARVTAATIVDAVLAADAAAYGAGNGAGAEGIFISCTALPALGVIEDLEARLGKPVVTSNQASLWRLLHHADLSPAPGAPGLLFEAAPLELAA